MESHGDRGVVGGAMNGTALTLGAIATLAIGTALRGRGSPNVDYGTFVEAFRLWYAEHDWANEPDEERAFRRWARVNGATYLGAGAQRIVFSVPGGALKVAFDRDGEMANSTETEVWEDAPASIRRHLVPVLAGEAEGGTPWILMEEVKATGRGRMSEATRKALNACGIQDLTTQNLADDGRLFDYGWLYHDLWDRCTTLRGAHGSAARISPMARVQYHGTTWERADRILVEGLRLPTLGTARTNLHAVPTISTSDHREAARLYGPAVFEVRLRPEAVYLPRGLHQLRRGENGQRGIERWSQEALDRGMAGVRMDGFQDIIGNQTVDLSAIASVTLLNPQDRPRGSASRLPAYPGPTLSAHATSAELANAYLALRAAVPDLTLLRVLYAFAEADMDHLPHPGPEAFTAPLYFPAPSSMAANLQAGRFPLTRELLRAMPGAWAAAVPFAAALRAGQAKRRATEARREVTDAAYEAQGVVLEPHAMPRPATLRGRDVWLFHGTASTMLPRILRDGLVPGRDAKPPRKRLVGVKSNVSDARDTLRYQPHVFLTADDGNGAGTARGYAKQAAQHHGGEPVVLRVLVPYDELEPDPDDQDLRSGRHQFVIRQVSPEAIREVNGVRRRLTNRRGDRRMR